MTEVAGAIQKTGTTGWDGHRADGPRVVCEVAVSGYRRLGLLSVDGEAEAQADMPVNLAEPSSPGGVATAGKALAVSGYFPSRLVFDYRRLVKSSASSR